MRAVFLNQRDLLITRGARCTLPHRVGPEAQVGWRRWLGCSPRRPAPVLRWVRAPSRTLGIAWIRHRFRRWSIQRAAVRGRSGDGGDAVLDIGGAQRLEVIASGSRRRIMLLKVGFTEIISRITGRAARQPCPVHGPDWFRRRSSSAAGPQRRLRWVRHARRSPI